MGPEEINKYISTQKAYLEVRNIVNKTDLNEFVNERKYKKQREQWIASVFIRGIEKLTNKNWFIQMQDNDPPDFKTVTENIATNDYKTHDEAEVEILFILEDTANKFNQDTFSSDLAQFMIDKKIKNKKYPHNYILIVYGNFTQIAVDENILRENIRGANPKLGQIWMLVCVDPNRINYKIFELFPENQDEAINIVSDFNE
jgi:hypothetical protein